MASTLKLSDTIAWAKPFIKNRPVSFGATTEPAVTSANTVKGMILGPPFTWRWNRLIVTFTCVPGQQDYQQGVTNFGWIETASIQDTTTNKWIQFQPKLSLSLDSTSGRPMNVSAQIDDNQGNITFRMMPVPDKAYPVSITIQQKTVLFSALSGLWSPIPDEFSYIFNLGFLSFMLAYHDDARSAYYGAQFVSHLLAASDGLTETQMNIFLSQWSQITGQPVAMTQRMIQGTQARGV